MTFKKMLKPDQEHSRAVSKFIGYLVWPNSKRRDSTISYRTIDTVLPIPPQGINEDRIKQLLADNNLDREWQGIHYSDKNIVHFALSQWSFLSGGYKYQNTIHGQ